MVKVVLNKWFYHQTKGALCLLVRISADLKIPHLYLGFATRSQNFTNQLNYLIFEEIFTSKTLFVRHYSEFTCHFSTILPSVGKMKVYILHQITIILIFVMDKNAFLNRHLYKANNTNRTNLIYHLLLLFPSLTLNK